MEQFFDAIVIGGGNGGMSGALTMTQAGKKVLLIEKHNITGGCATSFKRGRFEFEVALHQMYGIGDNPDGSHGVIRQLLENLQVFDQIKFKPQADAFRLAFKDFGELTLPNENDDFVNELKDYFGEEADAIEEYQGLIDAISWEFDKLYEFIAAGKPMTEADFPNIYKYAHTTGKEMLDKYFTNPMLKGAYQCLFGYLGIPIERIPFNALAVLYIRHGCTWNITGTSWTMSNAMATRFMDLGGVLKLNTKVERILIEDNAVKGVVTDKGETFYAPFILCNANRINAYVNMIDNDLVPESIYEDLRVSPPGQSIFALYVGLDCTAEEAGIENGTSFLMDRPGAPGPRPIPYEAGMRRIEGVSTEYVTCYNVDDPEYGEPGTATFTILASKVPEPFLDLPPEKYHEVKFAFAERILERFYEFYPEVRNHLEEVEIATPMTFLNYIGSPGGAIYGVDCSTKDMISSKFDPRSPFKGLYFCGVSLIYGGFHTTLRSGNACARLILKDMEEGVVPIVNDYTGMQDLDIIKTEIATSKMYNVDHRAGKGRIKRVVDLYHPEKIEFRVTEIRQETRSAKTFRLTPVNGYVPPFVPGQYLSVKLEIGPVHTSRAYTISSSCAQRGYYEITVRRAEDGFVSEWLHDNLKVGDTVVTSGPQGQFYRFPALVGKKLCYVAGGSGITPFMSMLQSDADRLVSDMECVLIYGCSKEDDIIFAEKLKALEGKLPGFKLVPVISEPTPDCKYRTGFITAELIKDVLGTPEDYTFFLCGPEAMYNFVKPALLGLGVPGRKIRVEAVPSSRTPSEYAGWPKEIAEDREFTITLSTGESFKAKAGETVMVAIEKAGLIIQSRCRAGECSFCRSRLLKGEVFMAPSASLRKGDENLGYIHPCVSYPLSDLELWVP